MERSMLIDAKLERKFWHDAVNIIVYFLNREPSKALDGMTPQEGWTGERPSI